MDLEKVRIKKFEEMTKRNREQFLILHLLGFSYFITMEDAADVARVVAHVLNYHKRCCTFLKKSA